MRINILPLAFVIIGVVCPSCIKENCIEKESGALPLVLVPNTDYSPHNDSGYLPGNYDGYLKFFTETDYELGISSRRDGALAGEDIQFYSGLCEVRNRHSTRSPENQLPNLKSFINGVEVTQDNLESSSNTRSSSGLKDVFGKTIQVSFSQGVKTRSDDTDHSFYVPQKVSLISPSVDEDNYSVPLCYVNNFVLRWNEDLENNNNILIVVEWNGTMVFGNDIPDTFVRRVCSVPDNGITTLPYALFEGIPDTAFCNLIILRGNIENFSENDYSYKLVGESHQLISFVLIRNIKKR